MIGYFYLQFPEHEKKKKKPQPAEVVLHSSVAVHLSTPEQKSDLVEHLQSGSLGGSASGLTNTDSELYAVEKS